MRRDSMKTNEYLYGDGVEVPEIPAEIKMRRIELLNEKLDELLEIPHHKRNGIRVNAIIRAIEFWENIDKEMEVDVDW